MISDPITTSDLSPANAPFVPRLMLATDLDGTFLAGSPAHRQQLYRLVDRHPEIRLTFVTGRGLEAVMPLLSDPSLPRPDYVICDVGGTVVDGRTLQPIQPLQTRIDRRWPGEHAVATEMAGFRGLVRQDVPQERRCSYFCEPDALADVRADIEATAKRLGAVIEASDVRPSVKEQVESLGAKFIMTEALKDASGTGGYARELTDDEVQRVLSKEAKKRDEAATAFADAGRAEQADRRIEPPPAEIAAGQQRGDAREAHLLPPDRGAVGRQPGQSP